MQSRTSRYNFSTEVVDYLIILIYSQFMVLNTIRTQPGSTFRCGSAHTSSYQIECLRGYMAGSRKKKDLIKLLYNMEDGDNSIGCLISDWTASSDPQGTHIMRVSVSVQFRLIRLCKSPIIMQGVCKNYPSALLAPGWRLSRRQFHDSLTWLVRCTRIVT